MKGYKAFDKGWVCRGFQYELGNTYELPEGQKLKICKCGFHFCKNPIDVFGYYPLNDETLIAEVEALGEIQQEGTKFVTNKIRIIKEFTRKQLQALILDGRNNTGEYCTGSYNSGIFNSGNYNSGGYNSGACNSGNRNSGDCNSGNFNSGNYNSGIFNSGDYNSGIFNTNEPCMRAFNKTTCITYSDFIQSLDYSFSGLWDRIHQKNLDPEDRARIEALPNYDADIFAEITGIRFEEDE